MKANDSISNLTVSRQDKEWGTTISTVGRQRIPPGAFYAADHQCRHTTRVSDHLFRHDMGAAEEGRILHEYQLLYITDGQGTFQSAHCPLTRVSSGQMILLFPDEWHTYQPEPATGWYEHWIGFSGSAIDHLVAKGYFSPSVPIFDVGLDQQVIQLYHQASMLAESVPSGWQQRLSGIVQMLLGFTFGGTREHVGDDSEVRLEKVRQYIQGHYGEDISIDRLAAMAEMSPSFFRQRFKMSTGFAPVNYIKEVRIERSKELLVNTQLTSKEIAYRTGFNTPYYFSIVFKQSVGMSPLEYRSKSRGESVQ